jgi:hypothetical protein
MSYEGYIAWRRLSRNGVRGRDEMSAAEQREWDAWGFRQALGPDPDEARRLYLEATGSD